MISRVVVGILILAVLIAACGSDSTSPVGDPPVLNSFDAMPKQLATVVFTPTPTPVVVGGELVDVQQPTATPGPPRPTATLTPYVGVFIGEPTSESGEPAPTLAPYVFNAGAGAVIASGGVGIGVGGAGGACNFPVSSMLANAYNNNATLQERLGCPVSGGTVIFAMAAQPFERGNMFWRSDTRQIYALASNGQFWQVADNWQEGMPADDPAYAPPAGLIQPVRGFGLVWRSNPAIRDALGWGVQPEAQYDGFWQDFERGAMFVANDNSVYALFTAEGQHSGPLPR